jgi:hypothetical protein
MAHNHTLGTDPVWVARYRVTAALAVAKGADGRLRHCYHGALLDWLSDEQAAHFLRLRLVERVDTDPQDSIVAAPPADLDADEDTLDATVPDSGAVDECLAALAHLQLPAAAGAPTARTALRDAGHRFGNAVIAHAVKRRKELSRTADDKEDSFEAVEF